MWGIPEKTILGLNFVYQLGNFDVLKYLEHLFKGNFSLQNVFFGHLKAI